MRCLRLGLGSLGLRLGYCRIGGCIVALWLYKTRVRLYGPLGSGSRPGFEFLDSTVQDQEYLDRLTARQTNPPIKKKDKGLVLKVEVEVPQVWRK